MEYEQQNASASSFPLLCADVQGQVWVCAHTFENKQHDQQLVNQSVWEKLTELTHTHIFPISCRRAPCFPMGISAELRNPLLSAS